MKIVCLVENTSNTDLKPKHGVSFYIETKLHKILFDLGPNSLFIDNAKRKNIDLTKVDTVILSHGHVDHGGGLKAFLDINNTARIYAQVNAFQKRYVKAILKFNVGLDSSLKDNPNILLVNGDYVIDEELSLIQAKMNNNPSPINKTLFDTDKKLDTFTHEHSLLVKENSNVLFTGCSHSGVINILDSCNEPVDVQIGGFHIFNPISKKYVSKSYLDIFKADMARFNIDYYTCHCTGMKAYDYLAKDNNRVHYISCGMELELWLH